MFGQRVHCLARYLISCRIGKGECLGQLRSDLGWKQSHHGQDFDLAEVLRIMERQKVTLSNMIPTMLNMLVNTKNVSGFDFSNQRMILSGGAPIAPEVVRKIMDVFKCGYIQI